MSEFNWEEIERRAPIPPELRAPRPFWGRKIARREAQKPNGCGAKMSDGCAWIFLFSIFWLGVFLCYWSALALLIEPFGDVASGKITGRELYRGTPYLHFEWRFRNRKYTGEAVVARDFWNRTPNNSPAKIRFFRYAPALRPQLESNRTHWLVGALLSPLGLLMCALGSLSFLNWGESWTTWKTRRLLRGGAISPAVVVSVRKSEAQNGESEITFLFRAKSEVFEAKTIVPADKSPRQGEILTAIFPIRRPQNATLYETLDWKIKS